MIGLDNCTVTMENDMMIPLKVDNESTLRSTLRHMPNYAHCGYIHKIHKLQAIKISLDRWIKNGI